MLLLSLSLYLNLHLSFDTALLLSQSTLTSLLSHLISSQRCFAVSHFVFDVDAVVNVVVVVVVVVADALKQPLLITFVNILSRGSIPEPHKQSSVPSAPQALADQMAPFKLQPIISFG